MQIFDANSTNVTEVRTKERRNIQTDKRKDENYIPLGINAAGGIIKRQPCIQWGATLLFIPFKFMNIINSFLE